MPCSSPVSVPRYVFDPKHGGRIKRYFQYPCGHCLSCLRNRQMQYAFRAEWEALDPRNVVALFCTFTYAPEFLVDNELSVSDVQHYVRRLKKSLPNVRVRYMFCGEYGELYGRKHYHAILYFDKFIDYKSVADAWTFGYVDVAPFTPARAGYVAKYSVKQIGSEDDSRHKVLPFLLLSNGLGFYFLELYGEHCRKNYIGSWSNLSGFPVYLPRVFMDRLFPPKDKVHLLKYMENDASKVYYDNWVGNVSNFRFYSRLGYDFRLKLKTALTGLSTAQYSSRICLGNSFKSVQQEQAILSRIGYEIGRY